jgi:squalene-hopene/tetraprenyl-beta-curcumene cyclase
MLAALCIGGINIWRAAIRGRDVPSARASDLKRWNPSAAAAYLDRREEWWQSWPPAEMDHGTVCVSCHTVVPYALVRPALGRELNEKAVSAPNARMLGSVEWRVNYWSQVIPFYTDAAYGPGKTAQSHATEAVLNAVILSAHDAADGHLSPITRTAFNEAWELQEKSGENAGAWNWQDFHLAPWESAESGYQGAALMEIAVDDAPDHYASEPGVRKHLDQLRSYLRRRYAAQPLMSQLYVLWAAARIPDLLSEADRTKLIEKIDALQLQDGGWALPSLDQQPGLRRYLVDHWRQMVKTAASDGCATGLVVLAFEEGGLDPRDPALNRGLQWLERDQQKDGSWKARSLNEPRDPDSDIGRFMDDAATGYAVLALQNARRQEPLSNRQ